MGRSNWNTRTTEPPPDVQEATATEARRRRRRDAESGFLARLLGANPTRSRSERTPVRGIVMLSLGLLLALSSAVADAYLHRGIETSASPPYVIQVSGRGLATNIDLRSFPASQVESVAATVRANGFQYVRHPFYWSEIEPEAGDYNWETYDAIVRSFSDAGLEIVAVISSTPEWARAPEHAGFVDAPPINPDLYAEFVSVLVSRYSQYVRFYQIGDQPNSPERWGGLAATAADYLEVLAPAFNAARTANQESKVILAEFSATGAGTVPGADLRFLRAVYEAGGQPYFDVVAASVDGGTASPFDRRISAQTPSLSRAILFRETVHEHGDDAKPIWFTHYGWDGVNNVSMETQADYLVAGIERIRAEWPWTGLVFQWALRPDTVPEDEVGFALLNGNGEALPGFGSVVQMASQGVGNIAATGFVPTDSGPIDYTGSWASQHLQGRVFQTTSQTGAALTITFEGTGLVAYLRRGPEAGLIHATIDGHPLPGWPEEDGKSVIDLEFFTAQDIAVPLVADLDIGVHQLVLELASEGSMTVGGMVVSRDPPLRWPVVLALVSALTLIFLAVRDLVLYLGRYSGTIRQVDEQDPTPRLPTLPDWRPSLRT
ncbi:MAG: beta-galactosidase [Thermomicrobiales bacterium]|nr:beta-galactosidase [Thermomicrobiales bacterium]